ncbi:gamma-glutamyl-gamma-aminobutyrate hydrolase family protein [Fangia hongkongensis]|uniref:gamma-glutamyl-gamma-aminobutyrate hydrolase family protein n=1 Tax=Fangia hongkongensis TaxID=270495 RepID=UPI00036954F5|nr:gamma-glutamyl-gamma-aminobutyrate hydrolase family protein [Fangia hongkongensis]MBK2124128.1 gamma-glutamyl-gamma-aminobutyrate hydrolase family protein [Fangia hongkongensis]
MSKRTNMKKVGITCCTMPPDQKRSTFSQKSLFYIESDMANFFSSNNIMPILIPDFSDETILQSFVLELDAVIFHGGDDLCPESYNAPYLNKAKWPGNRARDIYELKVMDIAFQHKIPILGICRGQQLINTYFGGTLYQDIQSEVKNALEHRNANDYDKIHHSITFTDDSLLGTTIYPDEQKPVVNSVHHQAIKSLGEKLICEAYSPQDQVIEAIRYDDEKHFIYAVQWHPEFSHTLGKCVLDPQPLLDYFIQQISKER